MNQRRSCIHGAKEANNEFYGEFFETAIAQDFKGLTRVEKESQKKKSIEDHAGEIIRR